jgi:dihydrofolate reductase
MRKLKLQVQMSIDGFIAGPNGEMDWLNQNWGDDINAHVTALTEPVDTILLGRILAQGFIPYWTSAYNSPEPAPGSKKFVETPKIVFSKTLTSSEWDNTIVENGDLKNAVNDLKKQDGGDIIAYGGGTFVSSLIREKLVDELHLFVNPTVLGKGMPIFQDVQAMQNYSFVSAQPFDCGIVELTYKAQ